MGTPIPSFPTCSLIEALEQQAQLRPSESALVDDHEQITWSDYARHVRCCAAHLEGLGLKPGDRIGIHGLNSIELAVAILGCWRAGLVTVLLSPASKGPELKQELSVSGAAAYLGDPDLYPVGAPILEHCPELRLSLLLQGRTFVPEAVDCFPRRGSSNADATICPPDLAAILFSSGTTGIPKGVMHTHVSLVAMGPYERGFGGPPMKHVLLVVAPLSHITSLFAIAQCLVNGYTAVLERRFHADRMLQAVSAHRCTVVYALSPSGCQSVLEAQRAHRRDTSSCLVWPAGGDAIPMRVLQAWPDHFGQELLQGYSLTEYFPTMGNLPGRNRLGSIGIPLPGTEIRLINDWGNDCKQGEIEEIQLRGPCLFAGYWDDPRTFPQWTGRRPRGNSQVHLPAGRERARACTAKSCRCCGCIALAGQERLISGCGKTSAILQWHAVSVSSVRLGDSHH